MPEKASAERAHAKGITHDQVRGLLQRLGEMTSAGNPAGMASAFDVPALMMSEQGTLAFSSQAEIAKMFERAVQQYRAQGVVSTKPHIKWIEALSEGIAAVDVQWPGFDRAGTEKSTEASHYILQRAKDGTPRIRVALTRTIGA